MKRISHGVLPPAAVFLDLVEDDQPDHYVDWRQFGHPTDPDQIAATRHFGQNRTVRSRPGNLDCGIMDAALPCGESMCSVRPWPPGGRRGPFARIANEQPHAGRSGRRHGLANVGCPLPRAEKLLPDLAIGDRLARKVDGGRRPQSIRETPAGLCAKAFVSEGGDHALAQITHLKKGVG